MNEDELATEVRHLKRRMTEMEEWAVELADVLRRRTEELRCAAGRLEQAEIRCRQLVERTDEIERFAAEQLGADVADIRSKLRLAGHAFIGPAGP